MKPLPSIRNEVIQGRLLLIGGLFLVIYAISLTISPTVLSRSTADSLRWDHWIGVAVWVLVFYAAHRQSIQFLRGSDPYLLPGAALLSGWGMLTVWSMLPYFGLRQALWIAVSGGLLIAGFRLPSDLRFLRRFKYVWLTGSILLVALTLVLGVNPMGVGPRMWLGCCGIYFQPSEILKLLLITFLAAYLADRQTLISLATRLGEENRDHQSRGHTVGKPDVPIVPLIAASLVMAGVAVAVMVIQRDLGSASILIFLYTAMIYSSSRKMGVLMVAGFGLLLAGFGGYTAYDVIEIRVDAWLNPWIDPSGRSYQIVQALIAFANGGVFGRGPGLGSPELIPLSHSDLIFAAVAEQTGLIGTLGMLALIALITARGLSIALRSPNFYHRFLAAGLTAYLGGQSLLIIGGSLRLFPLTGITLPFVSYGGSSLLVSMLALLLLLKTSCPSDELLPQNTNHQAYLQLGLALGAAILLSALAAGWWAVIRSPNLVARTDNPRRAVSDRYVTRGSILDRNGEAITVSVGEPGEINRQVMVPALSNIIGYTDPTYGQSGLEAELDEFLRGLQGHPFSSILWNSIAYGQPPPGIDLRLTLDLNLQVKADRMLAGTTGALVLIHAKTGEILAMSSSPAFDANRLSEDWPELISDPGAPLLNRATLGRFPIGNLDLLFPDGLVGLEISPAPPIYIPTGGLPSETIPLNMEYYSPLQVALAAAVVSAEGVRPAPRLVSAVNLPATGWTPLPLLGSSAAVLPQTAAVQIAESHQLKDLGIWQRTEIVERDDGSKVTWYFGGSLPDLNGAPLAIGLVLESEAPSSVEEIGQSLLLQ